MSNFLFDTSVWINFLTKKSGVLEDMLYQELSDGNAIKTCPTIIQEILQGIRNDLEFRQIKGLLIATEILTDDYLTVSLGGAEIYRTLRKKGCTIRKPNDCLIAWYAINHHLVLVHHDQDFDLISNHFPLNIHPINR